jgi:hypothetical protein
MTKLDLVGVENKARSGLGQGATGSLELSPACY